MEKLFSMIQSHFTTQGLGLAVNVVLHSAQVMENGISISKGLHFCSSVPQDLQMNLGVYVSPSFSRVNEVYCSNVLHLGQKQIWYS